MKKRILITGGAGFIGSHLSQTLLDNGWHVMIIDDFNDFYDPNLKEDNLKLLTEYSNFSYERGDIVDKSVVKWAVEDFHPSHVVHLAARAGVRPSLEDPELYTRVNVVGTLNVLEAIKDHDIKNFIFGSSSSVYGNNIKVPFSETDAVDEQISPYAVTKRSGELMCYMYSQLYNIPTTCLRFFTVYGPRQRPDLAIRKFMTKILEGETIDMYGDGSSSRDYTYVDDIVQGITKSIRKPFEFEIINLGNSNPITLKDLISNIEEAVLTPAKIVEKPMQPGDVNRTYADISKAKKLLDWEPRTDFKTGLQKMATWLKKQ